MSPGRRPSPKRDSSGVKSAITMMPTTITRSHFNIAGWGMGNGASGDASCAIGATALERHANLAYVADVPQLGHREAHPRSLEVASDDGADVLGQRLQQLELARR